MFVRITTLALAMAIVLGVPADPASAQGLQASSRTADPATQVQAQQDLGKFYKDTYGDERGPVAAMQADPQAYAKRTEQLANPNAKKLSTNAQAVADGRHVSYRKAARPDNEMMQGVVLPSRVFNNVR